MAVATQKRAKKAGAGKVSTKFGGISSEAVERATGCSWDRWVKALNKDGAADMEHKDIALWVRKKYGIGAWWCQMVTVGYEQATGRRAKHQMKDGYRVGGSKTIAAPVAALYEAWSDPKRRSRWLPGADMRVRTATANKSMRITWEDAKGAEATDLIVMFYAKGPAKSQVTVEHGKHKTAAAGEKQKRFWSGRLGALAEMLKA